LFDEKTMQVLPPSMVAFGIEICSRCGKCSELIELLEFSRAAVLASVAHYVNEAFYDSKASICNFELDSTVTRGSEIEGVLFSVARATVSHFMWFDDEVFDSEDSEP
jgi:hypothetical protein